MKPEFWINMDDEREVIQINGYTKAVYIFPSVEQAKAGIKIMQGYVDKWWRRKPRNPLYPEYLAKECTKKGLTILHISAGMR